jgi:hypothetical protein
MHERIIEREIKNATSNNPVTSTRLIGIVRQETGKTITARRIRKVVEELRKTSKLPILATKRDARGYYLCRNAAEFESWAVEIRAHAVRELTTISEIKASFFGSKQPELLFI